MEQRRLAQVQLQKMEMKSLQKSSYQCGDDSWAEYQGPRRGPVTIDTIKAILIRTP